MKEKINNSIIHQLIFLVVIIALTLLIFKELALFFPSLLGAITIYVLSRNFFIYLSEKRKWNKYLAVGIIFLIAFLIISIPITLLIELTYSKVHTVISYSHSVNDSLVKLLKDLQRDYNFNLLSQENIEKLTNLIGQYIPLILNSTINSITVFFFSFFIAFFMLINLRKMEKSVTHWLPLKHSNTEKVGLKVKKMVQSNAVGIPVVALAQGITGLIGYAILGLDDLWFWFAMTTFTSMIPIVGSALVYVPIAILLYSSGQTWQAVFIILFGIVIIGSVDNICRFTLLKKLDDIHPLITVFGIIFGMNTFGFLGLIFGPLLLSLLFLLIQVYNDEYTDKK